MTLTVFVRFFALVLVLLLDDEMTSNTDWFNDMSSKMHYVEFLQYNLSKSPILSPLVSC